ncbi:MAG: metallophosphoesterase family protein [Anaerolineae bacterium]|nr:metallophosphoesterase family protein [Anaerolineae bacterium]
MRIAVLSDIHGNLPALQAVTEHMERWQPNAIVVAGDTVNRGPLSRACWQFVQEQCWQVLKGNHEEYVLAHGRDDDPQSGPHFAVSSVSRWTYGQLNGAVAALAALPDSHHLATPGGKVRICHASMTHNRDGIYAEADDAHISTQIAPPPTVFVTAHTHKPFTRQVNGTLVVNAGSVGTPADEDSRASYAQIGWRHGRWQADIIRVSYDTTQATQDYLTTGLLAEAGPMAWLAFYEWQLAVYLYPDWMRDYWPLVTAGEMTVDTAVRHYLDALGLPIPV